MPAATIFDATGRTDVVRGAPAGQERQRPNAVQIGASLLALAGVFSVGRVVYGVLVNPSVACRER
jgi:hypothetical protein